jgi:hypothetical protein
MNKALLGPLVVKNAIPVFADSWEDIPCFGKRIQNADLVFFQICFDDLSAFSAYGWCRIVAAAVTGLTLIARIEKVSLPLASILGRHY